MLKNWFTGRKMLKIVWTIVLWVAGNLFWWHKLRKPFAIIILLSNYLMSCVYIGSFICKRVSKWKTYWNKLFWQATTSLTFCYVWNLLYNDNDIKWTNILSNASWYNVQLRILHDYMSSVCLNCDLMKYDILLFLLYIKIL